MKKLMCFLSTVFLILQIFGQNGMNDNYWKILCGDPSKFSNVMDSFNLYIQRNYPDSIPHEKEIYIKDYHRFINFWQHRLGISESVLSYGPYFKAVYANILNPICQGEDSANWQILGPTNLETQYLGLVSEVLADPENPKEYLLSSELGGIWKRYEQSDLWVNVTESMRFPGVSATEIIRDPFDHDHIIASTGSGLSGNYADYGMGIIESFDNGDHWSIMQGFDFELYPFVSRVIADPNDVNPNDGLTLYAITKYLIFYSNNSGVQWINLSGPPLPQYNFYQDIEIDDRGSIYVSCQNPYINTQGLVYKNDGSNWINLSSNFHSGEFGGARITKPYEGKIFVMVDYQVGTGEFSYKRRIYLTTDYGENWQTFGEQMGASPKNEIEYSPESSSVFVGNIKLINTKEIDPDQYSHGFTTLHVDIRDIALLGIDENGDENLLVATDGGITLAKLNPYWYLPPYPDITVENLNGSFLPIGEFMGIGVSHSYNEFIVGGAMHCRSFKFVNNNWLIFGKHVDGGDCEVNWDDPSLYYYMENGLMFNSNNDSLNPGLPTALELEFELNPNDPYQISFGTLVKDTNPAQYCVYNELTSSLISKDLPIELKEVGAIGISTDQEIYVADFGYANDTTPNRIVKSTNEGNSWVDLSQNPVYELENGIWVTHNSLKGILAWKAIRDIIIDPVNTSNLWICLGGIFTNSGVPIPEKFRVLKSTDGGNSWYDYSENLPPFPVSVLEFQSGSPQRIFAGTDAGVFYRDSTMTQWECFSNGLPVCVITDLDYDPCNDVLYASTYSWSTFKTQLNFNDNYDMELSQGSYVWDTPRELNYNLIIPDSCTLEINSNIHIAPNKSIIVQRGGNLIIDGGRLFNNCGHMWQGIQVWGTTFASQYTPGAQGKLTIINGGTIENAIAAVRLANTDGVRYVAGYEGGIIQTEDAHFINNRIGVRFYPYRNLVSGVEMDNLSYFRNSEFLTNAELADESIPDKFIYLDGVKGIDINGCSFTNSRSEEEATMSDRGIGIYSNDATYTVTWYCESGYPCQAPTPCSFTNLNYGIKAYNTYTTRTFTVNHSSFYNNLTGIYLNNIDNAEIIFNDFELYNVSLFHDPDDIFGGIYLDNYSSLFTVEENNFYNEDENDPKNEIRSIGITVNNSGDDANMIYRNTFSRLHIGILAQNRNRGTSIATGLKLKCNVCTNNLADFAVTADTASSNKGISVYQGTNTSLAKTAPAGNLFTHANNNDPYSDFNNTLSRQGIYYFHHPGTSQNLWVPAYYQNITPTSQGFYSFIYDSVCPSNYSLGGGLKNSAYVMQDEEDLRLRMILMENLRDSASSELSLWIDAGNTQELNDEVESSTPDESLDLYDELIATSPYLSDTVLASSIDKEDVLVNAMIRDIMVANPHGAKKEDLIEALEQRVPPLPEYMMAEIMAGLDSIAQKEQRESEIAWYAQERDLAYQKLIKIYLDNASLPSAEDSLTSLILNHGNLNSQYFLAARYLEHNDASTASSILDEIPDQFEMDSKQQSEHQDYLTIFSIISNISQQGLPLDSIDNTSRQILYQIAENDSRPASMAQNILQYIDTVSYPEVYILPTSGPVLRKYEADNPEVISGMDKGNIFRVFPNPSHEYYVIEYYFEEIPRDASYSINDPLGRIIEEGNIEGRQNQLIRRTTSYSPGIYNIKLIINGKAEKALKLNVIK